MKKSSKQNNFFLKPITSKGWHDYTLLDSGNKRKLERFGSFILNRFEPEAVWKPALPTSEWAKADAEYNMQKRNGEWVINKQFSHDWKISIDQLTITLKLSNSRHIGIFPEQRENWQWARKLIQAEKRPLKVLNLFAYTGVGSLFCVNEDTQVTHVDASRAAIEVGKRSQTLSSLAKMPIRWIVDDAEKYMQREIRRGNRYDAIMMDPPVFGRGPNGEVWKFEESIDALLSIGTQLLSDKPLFLLLTAYNIPLENKLLAKKINDAMRTFSGKIEYGALIQLEQSAGRKIEQAQYVRWLND